MDETVVNTDGIVEGSMLPMVDECEAEEEVEVEGTSGVSEPVVVDSSVEKPLVELGTVGVLVVGCVVEYMCKVDDGKVVKVVIVAKGFVWSVPEVDIVNVVNAGVVGLGDAVAVLLCTVSVTVSTVGIVVLVEPICEVVVSLVVVVERVVTSGDTGMSPIEALSTANKSLNQKSESCQGIRPNYHLNILT